MKYFIVLMCSVMGYPCVAQKADTNSVHLKEVEVVAFEQNRRLMDLPAPVSIISKPVLNRFNNSSLVPAFNSFPGIRMEERSPGSYRLNIRGSSLRSPFGVRNVKIYYNGIPYTDPSGNSFLNSIGFYSIQGAQIFKGPGSSLYGAGTGGVVLLQSQTGPFEDKAMLEQTVGSYGLTNTVLTLNTGDETFKNSINFQLMQGNGYRNHTNMDRFTVTWDATVKVSEKGKLNGHFLTSTLNYQIPGALTAAEMAQNPKLARPAVGASPSSQNAQAAAELIQYFGGVNLEHQLSERLSRTIALYASFSKLNNPTIRNFGKTFEPHGGTRTVYKYLIPFEKAKLTLLGGLEVQQGFANFKTFGNNNGQPDTLQTDDEIRTQLYTGFVQGELELPKGWSITGGLSLNLHNLEITRLTELPVTKLKRKFNTELAPRIAIIKKVNPSLSIYGNISKGFSPPTTAEILPSTGIINTTLDAEDGINYEIGTRGSLLQERLFFDVNLFHFNLKNTIVQRRDQFGADFFSNSGSTRQQGIEAYFSWLLIKETGNFFSGTKTWMSHTFHRFRYEEFTQLNTDYSGNKLPSIAPYSLTWAVDIQAKYGFSANITYSYSDPIPLNDANTVYADAYHLLGARLNYTSIVHKKVRIGLFAGADNIFNSSYSLGNDINAFGGRYFNPAPGANYFAGFNFQWYRPLKK